MAMENIHNECYGLLLDTLLTDATEKNEMINSIETVPAIRRKAEWAIKYINSEDEFAIRLVAFAVIEGIFFSGSFCAIFWLKKRGLLPGVCLSNSLISRDENLHTDFAVLLFHMIVKKPSQERIHELFRDAVAIEKTFICDALPCALIGMNAAQMSLYIEYVADRLLVQLGYNKIWNTDCPFDWMESMSLDGYSNFFEKVVPDYGRPGALTTVEDRAFGTDADF
jgi:ribonucleotide reductase beta subunit family protein with ferritin-like domain